MARAVVVIEGFLKGPVIVGLGSVLFYPETFAQQLERKECV